MFYQKSVKQVLKEFKSNFNTGLSQKEATLRLKRHGENVLPTKPPPPIILKLIAQFQNILILILLGAAALSLFLGDALDAIAIFAIVVINATIGFIQEVNAQKTLESLKQKEVRFAMLLRDGTVERVQISEIVVGDILILEEGAQVGADARLIESFSLRVDESILTGESMPTSKNPYQIHEEVALGDQKNMLFEGTQVISGRGKAVVVKTASKTEIGKIARALEEEGNIKTPLTIELERVGGTLTIAIGIIALAVFGIEYFKKAPLIESILVAISLAVAAIPEGLPAVVTVVLSIGVKRLADKKTIVKKLPAVETLGAIRIIATDKTGTITQNKINVVQIVLSDGASYSVSGVGYEEEGVYYDSRNKIINPKTDARLESLLTIGVLANNATIHDNAGSKNPQVLGDTTEASLLVAAARAQLDSAQIQKANPRIFEVPFSSERKMMSVVVCVNDTGDHFLYTKGAPEIILSRCTLPQEKKAGILSLTKSLAKKGLRSLAFAKKKLDKNEVKETLEQNTLTEEELEFVGLMGMQDPLRPEVKEAFAKATLAGIKTIMITGDHKETACAIAKEAGILKENNLVFTEDDVVRSTREEIAQKIKEGATVFARISPLGKLKIIDAIKLLPHTHVATTGDGVNDAPALKASHIGIAMGQTGTDITREVADMVITDDNYATIIDAIREGRIIFANLVKFIRYLISCNLSEVIVVAGGVLLGVPVPLLPIQILWINLITDGFPALALGVDPPEFDVMKRPPRNVSEGILHKRRWVYMIIEGTIMGGATLGLFVYILTTQNFAHAQTMAFATLAFSQLTHAFNNRSTKSSLFTIGIFSNTFLIIAVLFSVILQVAITQTDWGNRIFKTTFLGLDDWFLVFCVSLVPFFVVELKKQLRFRYLP